MLYQTPEEHFKYINACKCLWGHQRIQKVLDKEEGFPIMVIEGVEIRGKKETGGKVALVQCTTDIIPYPSMSDINTDNGE